MHKMSIFLKGQYVNAQKVNIQFSILSLYTFAVCNAATTRTNIAKEEAAEVMMSTMDNNPIPPWETSFTSGLLVHNDCRSALDLGLVTHGTDNR